MLKKGYNYNYIYNYNYDIACIIIYIEAIVIEEPSIIENYLPQPSTLRSAVQTYKDYIFMHGMQIISKHVTMHAFTAIRLPCCGPVTSRRFICNPDVTDYVGFRLTYPRSDRLLTNSIAGRDIHPREYVNNTASLRHFIVISLVPIVIVASYIYKCSLIYYCKSYID